ncbi:MULTISPECIES: ABC transporter ATP-binding protein [Alphaproteobacteria]|uniref:ABC transporter ATP-binding protein n=2 Tax=Pseudomonadota TaxID=1224 RepID=UPI0019D39BEA|nr:MULTISPECIES: ABC transporter ATP-binding protein [Alphaproteobacteria]MBY6022964.1 ABC transporter ATP-binding protein [Nitratireductor sp. DP7N14-4]MBN7758171.1 ABC transporter ATP-binding protein [Nitratireductor aquimarinus]MBN7776231.1 ABC transporter ATP-binding protein [Nitratireductor pacificus]MCV0349396.1 ABC transporter ATP-binding protein [Nitratireductor sp.]MDV2965608.1 ABC transporter ATP-binding protein [Nitratireductor aquimarinus]
MTLQAVPQPPDRTGGRTGDASSPAGLPIAGNDVALSFENISMQFPDGTQALEDVSLTIRKGEFVSIVGPSGCGKSTLLKIASGLFPQTSGIVKVDRSQLGYTFQDATLLPWRKVLGNVELLMELRGFSPEERRRIAMEQISLVGLDGFAEHYPKRLSGGMRMRASLARSLALNPSVFMFDEPFGALDEITRERLNDELVSLFMRNGFSGLFITHSISEAVYLSSKVVVMSRRPGQILEVFDIPFAYPRDPELRYTPEFATLCSEVSVSLRNAIEN